MVAQHAFGQAQLAGPLADDLRAGRRLQLVRAQAPAVFDNPLGVPPAAPG